MGQERYTAEVNQRLEMLRAVADFTVEPMEPEYIHFANCLAKVTDPNSLTHPEEFFETAEMLAARFSEGMSATPDKLMGTLGFEHYMYAFARIASIVLSPMNADVVKKKIAEYPSIQSIFNITDFTKLDSPEDMTRDVINYTIVGYEAAKELIVNDTVEKLQSFPWIDRQTAFNQSINCIDNFLRIIAPRIYGFLPLEDCEKLTPTKKRDQLFLSTSFQLGSTRGYTTPVLFNSFPVFRFAYKRFFPPERPIL